MRCSKDLGAACDVPTVLAEPTLPCVGQSPLETHLPFWEPWGQRKEEEFLTAMGLEKHNHTESLF